MKALLRSSLVLVLAAGLLAGCERPPVDSVQRGFRGTAMVGVYNPRTVAMQVPNNQPPAPQGPSRARILADPPPVRSTRTSRCSATWESPTSRG